MVILMASLADWLRRARRHSNGVSIKTSAECVGFTSSSQIANLMPPFSKLDHAMAHVLAATDVFVYILRMMKPKMHQSRSEPRIPSCGLTRR